MIENNYPQYKNRPPKGHIAPEAANNGEFGGLISPAQIAAGGSEHAHQAAVMQWVALVGIRAWPELWFLHAVPNGGDRKMSVAASLKAEGVKSGVPDLCLPVPKMGAARFYNGLYIEMKKPGLEGRALGGRFEKQRDWHVGLVSLGYGVATAYGWQAACWVLVTHLRGQLVMPDDGDCLMASACSDAPVVERTSLGR